MFTALASSMEVPTDVEVRRYELTASDGAVLPLTWYEPATEGRTASAAMLYLHGGGMIMSLEQTAPVYDVAVRQYVSRSGVPALVFDYRVAPEHPHPTPVEDCYAALQWLEAHAAELDVDPTRLAVGGDSAGGGLAAGVALLARDRSGPRLALQLLIYPMLDDRTVVPDPQLPPEFLVWNYDDNVTGWGALLGDASGGADVSPYAAPARAADLAGLPRPTSTSVTSTSSATRTSTTPAACSRRACRRNCTSSPVVRTASRRWPPTYRCRVRHSTTGPAPGGALRPHGDRIVAHVRSFRDSPRIA